MPIEKPALPAMGTKVPDSKQISEDEQEAIVALDWNETEESRTTRWLGMICGRSQDFALEYQVLNWVLVTSALMGVLLTAENFLLRIPSPAAESTLVVTAVSLAGYYLVRIKRRFSRLIAPLLYALFLLPLTFIWFSSAGLEGAVPYLYIVPILAGVSIMHGRTQRTVLSLTILHLFSLIAVEKIAPQLVSPYPSDYARWLDTLVSVIYAVSYGVGYTGILLHMVRTRTAELEKNKLESIIKIDSELNHQIQDLDLLLERILLEARKVVHADAGSIYIKEEDKLVIKYAQNDSKQKELPPGQKLMYSVFSVPINEKTISGYCALTGDLVNVTDVYNIPPDAPYSFNTSFDRMSGYKTTSNLTVPLENSAGLLLGVIQVMNARNENGRTVPFKKADELLISHFASNATVAFQRAYLNRAMILRMIRMAELRDPKETGAHVSRVAGYAVEIYDRWAYRHRVEDHELEKARDSLKIAAMLHDVGKVAISDQILKKPARFTPEEYAIMQTHSCLGARLFNDPQSPLDAAAASVALTHHESWDGTGYPGWIDIQTGSATRTDDGGKPLGLKGEEIPLVGRIVAIADVFDALSSQRVYKQAWGEEDVHAELRRLAGVKFDPELVEIFFDILPSIKPIQEMYPEQRVNTPAPAATGEPRP